MIKEVKSVDISYINSLLHGGPGSGRYKKGTSGYDGDGDGIIDDKHNQPKVKKDKKKALEDLNEETKKVNQINANIKAKQEYARLTTPQSDAGKSITKTGEAVATLGKQVGEAPFGESGHKEYAKYENLNDEELRRKINRLKNEREYSDLTGDTKYIKSGKDKTREILQTVGAVLGIVGTAVTIISTVRGMKKTKVQQSEDLDSEDSLMHHGIKGMNWGVRNEQEYEPHPSNYSKPTFELTKHEIKVRNREAKKEWLRNEEMEKRRQYQKERTTAEGSLAVKKTLRLFGSLALGPLAKPLMGNNAMSPKEILKTIKSGSRFNTSISDARRYEKEVTNEMNLNKYKDYNRAKRV